MVVIFCIVCDLVLYIIKVNYFLDIYIFYIRFCLLSVGGLFFVEVRADIEFFYGVFGET